MKISRKMKNRVRAYFWLTLVASFMVCVFAPLETYLTNITEFWYGYSEIISVAVLTFVICFACAWIPFLLLSKTKIFRYFYTLCFCLFVGFYIQGNYVARPYGVFDGREISWNDAAYHSVALASILIFVGVALATVLCCKFLRGRIYKIATFASIVVLGSQLITLGVLYAENGGANEQEFIITDNKQFDLSKEKNIIVLMLDTFDGKIMTELLEGEYGSRLKEDLTGFTFYPDTVGCYPLTRASIPYILTGTWYLNDVPYNDYVQKAYEENPIMLDSFKEAGYSVGMYVNSPMFVYHKPDVYLNVLEGQYQIKDYVDFIKNTYKMVVFNYVPHQLKKYFVMDYGNINRTRTMDNDHNVYDDAVPEFYRKFSDNGGFAFDEKQPAFRFYHTDGIHQSYTFDENIEKGVGLSVYDEAKGCMTLLRTMVEELKAEGVYDKTAIIVMADHSDGWRSARGSNPLFMIKNFGETGELEVSSLAVSYEDFEETACSIIKEEVLPGSVWSDDIKGRTERKFMWYQPASLSTDIEYFPVIRECVVKGAAWDPDSIRITGTFYDAGRVFYDPDYYKYELGTPVNLTDSSAVKHFEYGLEVGGGSRDKESQMRFDVENVSEDLTLTVKYRGFFGGVEPRVLLFVNGTAFGEIRSEEPVQISKSLIEEDGVLRLRFEYPNASTPAAQGINTTTYMKAVLFNELVIDRM